MNKEIFKMSIPINEPILNYSPGSKEKKELKKVLNDFKSKEVDIPMYINGKEIRTDNFMFEHYLFYDFFVRNIFFKQIFLLQSSRYSLNIIFFILHVQAH